MQSNDALQKLSPKLNRKTFSKKPLIIIILLVFLSACGGGNNNDMNDVGDSLLNTNENEEIDTVVNINLLRSTTNSKNRAISATPSRLGGSTAVGSVAPQLHEFSAETPSGQKISGVLYGLAENVLDQQTGELMIDDFAATIKSREMRLRATVKKVNGTLVLLGTVTPTPKTAPNSFDKRFQNIGWTIIALKEGNQLSGPTPDRVFHYYGSVNAKAACNNNVVSGVFQIEERSKVLGTLIGVPSKNKSCDDSRFSGQAKLSMDARVISTHIGPLLSSEGFLAPKGKFKNAAETFGLAIAESIPGNGDIVNVRTNENTHIVDPEAAENFVGFNKQYQALVFTSLTGSLADLREGDFIVSKPRPKIPNGILLKVQEIQTVGNYIAVKTQRALISDILESASIDVNRRYTVADVAEANEWFGLETTQTYSTSAKNKFNKAANNGDLINVNVNKIVFDKDGDHSTKDDQVVVSGNLSFNPNVVLKLDCSGLLCSKPDFVAKFVLDESSEIKVTGDIRQTLHKSFNLPPSIWLPPITAGPLIFTPKFVVQLNVDGTLGASLKYSATQEFTLEAGVDFNPSDGWGTISDLSNTFDSTPPEFSGDISGKAELAIRGEFKLYGVAGVFADLGGYIKLKAEIPRSPIWELYGGFASSVGVDLDVIVWSAQFSEDLINEKWTIEKAENQPPDAAIVSQPYPKYMGYVELDGDVTMDVSSFDPEQGEDCCLVELKSDIEGIIGKVHTSQFDSINHTFKTEGIHTITASVTDNEGLTTVSEIEVDVRDRLIAIIGTPQTTFDAPGRAYVDEYSDFKLTLTDDRGIGEELSCCSVAWYINDVFIERTDGDFQDTMTHTFRHKMEWPEGVAPSDKVDIVVRAEAEFDIANDGLSAGMITRSTIVSLNRQKPLLANSLSEISKTFPEGNTPPYEGEEVIYSVTLSDPELCNNVSWSSSIAEDGIGENPNGFLGYGIQNGDIVTLTKKFDTEDTRTITVNMQSTACEKVSASVKTKVVDAMGKIQQFEPAGFGANAQQ